MITQTTTKTTKTTKKTPTKKIKKADLPKEKIESTLKKKIKDVPLNVPFNGQMFQIRGKTLKGKKLYLMTEVEAAWVSTGGTGGRLDNWKVKVDVQELIKLTEIQVVSEGGRNGGTWGCEDAINLYAGHCDIRFQLALSKAFNAVARGDFEAAKKLTAYREQRDDSRFYYHELGGAIKEMIVTPTLGALDPEATKKVKDLYYRKASSYYSKEHTMINDIVGIASGVRDYVDEEILKRIIFLQKANTAFVYEGRPFSKRKETLKEMFKKRYQLH